MLLQQKNTLTSATKRPNILDFFINSVTIGGIPSTSYIFNGIGNSYCYPFYLASLDTDSLVDTLIQKKGKIAMLDIGVGMATTVNYLQNKHSSSIFTGITLEDYGRKNQVASTNYANCKVKIGNADNLDSYFGKESFDLIVSSKTFMHLFDPWGTLCRAYDALKLDGIFVCDELPGCDNLSGLITHLQQEGYHIFAQTASPARLHSFYIRKTTNKPILSLPMAYGDNLPTNEKVGYLLNNNVLHQQQAKSPFDYYTEGKKIIEQETQKRSNVVAIIDKCESLEQLAKNVECQTLSLGELYLAILAVFTRSISYSEYETIFSSIKENKLVMSLVGEFSSTLAVLRYSDYLSGNVKAKIIVACIMQGIVEIGQTLEATSFFIEEKISLEEKFSFSQGNPFDNYAYTKSSKILRDLGAVFENYAGPKKQEQNKSLPILPLPILASTTTSPSLSSHTPLTTTKAPTSTTTISATTSLFFACDSTTTKTNTATTPLLDLK